MIVRTSKFIIALSLIAGLALASTQLSEPNLPTQPARVGFQLDSKTSRAESNSAETLGERGHKLGEQNDQVRPAKIDAKIDEHSMMIGLLMMLVALQQSGV